VDKLWSHLPYALNEKRIEKSSEQLIVIAEQYILNGEWDKAMKCYEKIPDWKNVLRCYLALEDYESIANMANRLSDQDDLETSCISDVLEAIGMIPEAVLSDSAFGQLNLTK
jgi:tetratricopeptide (TPR) repeat protein